jgi:phosphotriesterase-related protein
MKEVVTVLGSIEPESLGFTSMHEHTLLNATVFRRRYETDVSAERRREHDEGLVTGSADPWDEPMGLGTVGLLRHTPTLQRENLVIEDEELIAGELADLKASGGDAIVDMSAIGLRSNVAGIKRLAQTVPVHIVMTTGFYAEDSWPVECHRWNAGRFRKHMVGELIDGIDETGVRPGHIKLAVTDLSEAQEEMLIGGTHAALETGVSLTVHPGFGVGSDGRRIANLVLREGLPPDRLVIAHADGFFIEHDLPVLLRDLSSWGLKCDYHRELLDRGVTLATDCFGQDWTTEAMDEVLERDWQRMAGLIQLIREGYSEQIVLGTDTFLKMLTRRGGGTGYCRLTRWVVPTLRRFGVSEYDIRRITRLNPMRLLSREAARNPGG